jgi:nitrite reductase/ring-hydroxylating ferredoxin subunit
MSLFRKPSPEPLWRDEFSVYSGDEKYVSRRQFSKFLVLTSLGLFVGNLWILLRSWFSRKPVYPVTAVAHAEEVPVGGVKLFPYPTPQDQCILLRTGADTYVAFSQKCTHLSCAVFYSSAADRFECPCHHGAFSVRDGAPLQGPPRRPLPRILLSRKGDVLFASGIQLES